MQPLNDSVRVQRASRKHEKELRAICQHLISALFSVYKSQELTKEIMAVSIPLNSVLYRSQQEKVPYVYTDRVEAVFKALESLGWIDVERGSTVQHNHKGYHDDTSKVLCLLFNDTYFKWVPQKLIPAEQLVEVRKKDKDCSLAQLRKSAIVPLPSLNKPSNQAVSKAAA